MCKSFVSNKESLASPNRTTRKTVQSKASTSIVRQSTSKIPTKKKSVKKSIAMNASLLYQGQPTQKKQTTVKMNRKLTKSVVK